MSRFEEFMNQFSYNPESFDADQFKAMAKAAHDEDISTFNSAVAAKEQEAADLRERNTKLGADNWALMNKTYGPKVGDVTPDPALEPEPEPPTIDSLFGKKK